jgi:hypothetical protein
MLIPDARRVCIALLIVCSGVARAWASADSPLPGPGTVRLFSISKSENKNQVEYAIRLNEHCAPIGDAPVLAYWRMLEKGPAYTEPLLAREVPGYGLLGQRVTARDSDGGQVRITLRALPTREILVEVRRDQAGKCRAWSTISIQGAPSYLYNVFVRLTWPFARVDYLLLQGWSLDGTHIVSEKLKP